MAYVTSAEAKAVLESIKDPNVSTDKVRWTAELKPFLSSFADVIDKVEDNAVDIASQSLAISALNTSIDNINNTYVNKNIPVDNPLFVNSLAWSKLMSTPTTLGGYGITDAFPLEGGSLSGTSGSGFVGYTAQSATPTTPSSGFRLFANNANALSWIGANGFVRTFDGTSNTADRVYTLPNTSGTFGLLGANQTWSGSNTFSAILNATGGIGTTTASNLDVFANNSLVARFFQSTGNLNVGSGTVDTGYRLNVQGQGNFTSGIRIAGTGTNPFTITQDSGGGTTTNLLVIANAAASLRIDATASEIALSTLSNNFRLISAQGNFNIANSTTGGTFRIGHQSGETFFDSLQNNRIRIRTNTGGTTLELMRMENTGNILIGTTTDAASAILNVRSTTKGVIFSPMTTAQRLLIASPAVGLLLYDTDLNTYVFHNGTSWRAIQTQNA